MDELLKQEQEYLRVQEILQLKKKRESSSMREVNVHKAIVHSDIMTGEGRKGEV